VGVGRKASRSPAYYSFAMDAARSPGRRRRPRRRTTEHALDARLVRVASLVLLPVALVLLLTVSTPGVLPPPRAAPAFDGAAATALSAQFSSAYPTRVPGTPEAALAAAWYRQTMRSLGLTTDEQVWREDLPGLGTVELRNVATVIRGRSPSTIAVVAYRDNETPGATTDNPSGTAALIELARPYGTLGAVPPPVPQRTLVLVSTDGGAWGGAGAVRFAEQAAAQGNVVAVVALHGLARPGQPRLVVAAGATASPARALVSTASARIEEQAGIAPALPSVAEQLVGLGIPFGQGEQAPFLERGVAALTVAGAGTSTGRGADPALRESSLARLGRATEALVGSVDASPRRSFGTPDAVFLGDRVVSGWALRLFLIAAVAPFAVGVVDIVARGRRRRLPLRPAARALRTRILFWLYGGVLLWLAALTGVLPTGAPLPFPPNGAAAGDWSPVGVALFSAAFAVGWAVQRGRLVPAVSPLPDETLAGYTAALVWLGGVALLLAITRPYALMFVLPSLYTWLWLPRQTSGASRVALYLLGLAGPAAGLAVLGHSLGTGALETALYVLELAGVGYVPPASVLITLAWAAAAAQLGSLAFGRYAPYASGAEPPPPGVVRGGIGRIGRRLAAPRQTSAT
jgi:hypothetical protein